MKTNKIHGVLPILVIVCILTLAFSINSFAHTEDVDGVYGKYGSFDVVYDEYMKAIKDGNVEKMSELEKIAEESLQKEIETSEKELELSNSITEYMPTMTRMDPDEQYYLNLFWRYFNTGYWEWRSSGVCLTLKNKLNYWSSSDKANGWAATYTKFRKSSNWRNTYVMQQQFYCHARLGYAAYEHTWNLEPWRTSMNPITCN